ncbi:hypothetical protein H8E77_32710 [bacterium]|nr:hypothetical protein [bacterium]
MLVVKATLITDQEVVLDRQTFEQIVQRASQIEEVIVEEEKPLTGYITTFDNERLALLQAANYLMPKQQENRMHELLDKNSEGQLTPAENNELDSLIDEYERRTIAKAEALVQINLK